MATYSDSIMLRTKPNQFYDITDPVEKIVKKSGVKEGLCNIFLSGSTGAIIINENEPMLLEDIRKVLEKIAGSEEIFQHTDNAHSHIQSALLGPDRTVPIKNNELVLGTWQSILFFEADNSQREREIVVTVFGD